VNGKVEDPSQTERLPQPCGCRLPRKPPTSFGRSKQRWFVNKQPPFLTSSVLIHYTEASLTFLSSRNSSVAQVHTHISAPAVLPTNSVLHPAQPHAPITDPRLIVLRVRVQALLPDNARPPEQASQTEGPDAEKVNKERRCVACHTRHYGSRAARSRGGAIPRGLDVVSSSYGH
jgi:hypothetical protein